ncbi:B3 domain-containing transcription factor ABI3-like isoform X1 [Primulina tabacum]|uniref:B3 domain-containing transcription factor ABI3-like isoform X1 n=1 Tax=Primulina tabacum TaxID=48773 RepID=UPI003F590DFB
MVEGGGGGGAPLAEHDRHSSDRNGGAEVVDMEAEVGEISGGGGGGAMQVEEEGMVMGRRDFWFEREQENTLLDMNDASVLFGDFPSLPELPCMSSSSSSSTAPSAAQTIAATPSSSSAASSSPEASWAPPKRRRDQTEAGYAVVSSSTTGTDIAPRLSDLDSMLDSDCVDMMEDLGYMDLIDGNDIWDPSSLFDNQEIIPGQEAPPPQKTQCQEENDGFSFLRGNKELSMIFLDWLKQNKDRISAEDVRKIKLNRSTIENASKRLGRTKEGMKRLLKLILEWVEHYQLQKNGGRRPQSQFQCQENPVVNPTRISNSNFSYTNVVSPDNSNPHCFPTTPCMIPVPTPHVLESPTLVATPPGLPPLAVGYCNIGGATYSNPPLPVPSAYQHHQQVMNIMPCTPSSEYQMMNNDQAWTPTPYTMSMSPQFSHSTDNSHPVSSYQQVFVGNPYQTSAPNGETLVRSGCSATKEARKNRMARQKRLYSNHHRHSNHKNQIDCSHPVGDPVSSPEDWMYSPVVDLTSTPPPESVPIPSVDASEDQVNGGSMQLQDFRGESYSHQRQNGCLKTERNLKFLMQKVLKQSDVGNLGRIVLPKKEAENHLPELETRDGVTIAMEDIGASRVWNMRYRFWPNNKSRMYLLENTGDFVKVNGLQEGDFIVIYLDTKCGKYMIRGVKVRQPEAKSDAWKQTGRRNARNLSRPRIRPSSDEL